MGVPLTYERPTVEVVVSGYAAAVGQVNASAELCQVATRPVRMADAGSRHEAAAELGSSELAGLVEAHTRYVDLCKVAAGNNLVVGEAVVAAVDSYAAAHLQLVKVQWTDGVAANSVAEAASEDHAAFAQRYVG